MNATLSQITHQANSSDISAYTISISNTISEDFFGEIQMALVMEVEDDVFFADLNRQISLLITEDDDSYNYPIPSHPPVVSIQEFSRTPIFQTTTQPHYKFDQISNKTCITTDHSCKGTGVFIPKSSQWSRRRSRRTNKQHLKPIPTPTITSHTPPTINDIRNKLQPPPATKSSRFFSGH